MIKVLLNLGTKDSHEDYLNNRIKVSNYVALLLLIIAAAYSGFTYFQFPEITIIPVLGVSMVTIGLFLNSGGLHGIYRTILAMMPMLLSASYQSYLVPEEGEPISASMMLMLSFALVPFVMFHAKEKYYLIGLGIFNFLVITTVPLQFGLLESDTIADEQFRKGFMFYFTAGTAGLLAFISLAVLSRVNYNSEQKSEQLLKEAAENSNRMMEKEKQLQQNLEQLEKAQEEDQLRTWASNGFAKFGAILRQQNDLSEQMDALVAEMAKYLNMNQAAIYIHEREGDEQKIVLQATYAYGRKKYKEQSFIPGEGLVGQCFLEKDYIYLREVPNGYTSITSGLGEATPSEILIVPLMTNEEVEGVIEFASFDRIAEYKIDFLMKLGSDIAASVKSMKINTMTRRLLEESRENEEQMRSQEEEMRQNMEELAATQEEMQRKEQSYIEEIDRLKDELVKTNQKLEQLKSSGGTGKFFNEGLISHN